MFDNLQRRLLKEDLIENFAVKTKRLSNFKVITGIFFIYIRKR